MAVSAASALAPFGASDAQLEALTVAFTAARAFAGASFAMVEPLQFLGEGLRVALGDLSASRCDFCLRLGPVETIGATAGRTAVSSLREAITVKLEALGAGTLTLACLLAVSFYDRRCLFWGLSYSI